MSVENVKTVMTSALADHHLTSNEAQQLIAAVGQYQDGKEHKKLSSLVTMMKDGVVTYDPSALQLISTQEAKGDQVGALRERMYGRVDAMQLLAGPMFFGSILLGAGIAPAVGVAAMIGYGALAIYSGVKAHHAVKEMEDTD